MNIRTAADYRPLAAARLDAAVREYLEAGCGAERTLAGNADAFARWQLLSRPLADVRGGHTRCTLFGRELEHPFLLAPVAYQRLFHPDGELASAAAADAQGGLFVASSLASRPFAEIAAASGRALWFQLYWQGDRPRTLRLLRRAQAAGCTAVMFTVDAPVKLATLQLAGEVAAVNLEAPLAPLPLSPGASAVFAGWMTQAPSWDDLAWLREQVDAPLLLKGVLHPADAQRALALGCDGLVVSNHGGRVLDGMPPALDVLPEIVAAAGGRPVLFDSGIRTGSDAFKALALGAAAVLVGRPYIWGLAAAGAMGVAHVLRLMRDELEMTMALTGCVTPAAIGGQAIRAAAAAWPERDGDFRRSTMS